MTHIEVLKQALEALEGCGVNYGYNGANQYFDEGEVDNAITALRQALEQPQEKYIMGTPLLDAMWSQSYIAKPDARQKAQEALDKKAENARELGLDYEPEPVAWLCKPDENGLYGLPLSEGTCTKCFPVYTRPQPAYAKEQSCNKQN